MFTFSRNAKRDTRDDACDGHANDNATFCNASCSAASIVTVTVAQHMNAWAQHVLQAKGDDSVGYSDGGVGGVGVVDVGWQQRGFSAVVTNN